jgi:hypothetical protein
MLYLVVIRRVQLEEVPQPRINLQKKSLYSAPQYTINFSGITEPIFVFIKAVFSIIPIRKSVQSDQLLLKEGAKIKPPGRGAAVKIIEKSSGLSVAHSCCTTNLAGCSVSVDSVEPSSYGGK